VSIAENAHAVRLLLTELGLTVDDLRYPGRRGSIGLFVGDGSRALFADLSIRSS